ncbi:MAG: amidophosphoribosyltransferase [Acidiferrobacterales bacterium]|nr:amidophosphoribosyltransferase [Acidiferrobacterales bacterium]
MCGVVAMLTGGDAGHEIYEALTILQHRGQDAAGIVTSDGQRVYSRTGRGLVRDVFSTESLNDLKGSAGIGHVRYPTAGANTEAECQPFYVNSPFGIALAHNGNLINAIELGEQVFKGDRRQINTSSDSEIMLNVLAYELSTKVRRTGGELTPNHVFHAVEKVFKRCKGAFSVTVLIVGIGILAFRDKNGIRPLIYGTREVNGRKDFAFASESVVLNVMQYEIERDVLPGEAIFVDMDGNIHSRQCAADASPSPCIFEYVYLSRPDSMIDRISVYKTRLRMGEWLGKRLLEQFPNHDIDVVMPVPDTSRAAALQLAHTIGVKYREGFIKNRYFDRTFIMPLQAQRKYSVRHKLNAINLEFENKNVLLVDDSIVRGTTAKQIVKRAREAGARMVYLASAAPPVRYPNVYGIDIPSPEELVATNRTTDEVCEWIGADFVLYQRLEDLIESVRTTNSDVDVFETSVFSGEYVTGDVLPEYLSKISEERKDSNREQEGASLLEFKTKQAVG